MPEHSLSRRGFLHESAGLAMPLMAAVAGPPLAAAAAASNRPVKVLCVGAHPDDPESGCAGTLRRYVDLGHPVTVLYLTRGERGIRDQGLEQAAKIRTAESEKACVIMGTDARFFGQIDGATQVTRADIEKMTALMAKEKPDIVFTHWPVDTHMDHQVASILVIRACMALGQEQHLYFFEVDTGDQSQGFFPNTYVDISAVVEKKKAALFAHTSQDGQGIWHEHHEVIAKWRGREAGVKAAEAFVHLNRDSRFSSLPAI